MHILLYHIFSVNPYKYKTKAKIQYKRSANDQEIRNKRFLISFFACVYFAGSDSVDLCRPSFTFFPYHPTFSTFLMEQDSPITSWIQTEATRLTFAPGRKTTLQVKVCSISSSVCHYLLCLHAHLLNRKLINNLSHWPTKTF